MLSLKVFCEMCPTHILLDKELNILHCGALLLSELEVPLQNSKNLYEIFELQEPKCDEIDYNYIVQNLNLLYLFKCKKSLKRCGKKSIYNKLILKGPMHPVGNGQFLLYLGSPFILAATELKNSNLFMSDMPYYEITRSLIMLNQSNASMVYEHKKLMESMEQKRNLTSKLAFQKERNLNLLNEFLPQTVIEKKLHANFDVSEHFPLATCMVAKIAFFDVILANCNAKEIFQIITDLFIKFDHLVDKHECYKVASMVESYFVVANVPNEQKDHAAKILNLSMAFLMESKSIIVPTLNLPVTISIAIHTGSVVAGLVGQSIVRYSVVGEGFNVPRTIIKLEDNPGQIVLTNAVKQNISKVSPNDFEFLNNGYKQVRKNMATCTFILKKNTKKTIWEIIDKPQVEGCSNDGYRELHENNLSGWLEHEKNILRQKTVIALMKNQPIPVALRRLKWSKRSKIADKSVDSGISVGSINSTVEENVEILDNTKVCTIM